MTIQEEIREGMIQGVNMILLHNLATRPKSTSVYANPEDDAKYRKWLENEVDEQLRKPLHSQGVVIKVERELPWMSQDEFEEWCGSRQIKGCGRKRTMCSDYCRALAQIEKAGYIAAEPLV